MSSFKFALNNFKYNMKEYGLYMAAIIIAVMVYYNFSALEHNPEVLKTESFVNYAMTAAQITGIFLLFFTGFFIWYSNSFFFNFRKKEIGTYIFLGIENWRIALMFALESVIQGAVALIAGLALGLLFARLFMMALAKVVLLDVSIDFFFSLKSVQETVMVFLAIFILVSMKNYVDISRSKLIDLFNFARQEEKPPSASILKAVFSLLMIATAYTICLIPGYITREENFFYLIYVVFFLVLAATMLLFSSLFPLLTNQLTNNKPFLYRGIQLVTLSVLSFRVKRIYRTLGVIALMFASSLVALSTSLSMRYFMDVTHDIETPYSFTYINDVQDEATQQMVRDYIYDYGHDILLEEHATLLYTGLVEFSELSDRDAVLIEYDDFARIITDLQVDNYEELIKELKPVDGKAIFIEKPGVVIGMSGQGERIVTIADRSFTIEQQEKIPLMGKGIPFISLVVTHDDYEKMAESLESFEFYGIKVDNPSDTWDLTMDLKTISPLNQSLYAYAEVYADNYQYIGVFYFLGLFLWLVFSLATGSILTFKILSDAMADGGKYQILSQLGMTHHEIRRSIYQQIAVYFSLPYLVGVIHSIVAISVLQQLMNFNLVLPTTISILITTLFFTLFYLYTAQRYVHIIEHSISNAKG